MKDQVQLLKVIFDFLDKLSEEQIELLITKKAKLRLQCEKDKIHIPATKISLDDVSEKLELFTTREEAVDYVNSLSLVKADLRAIAKQYNIPLGSKDTNDVIINKIIENLVGSKLRFDALYNTDLKR